MQGFIRTQKPIRRKRGSQAPLKNEELGHWWDSSVKQIVAQWTHLLTLVTVEKS